VRRQICKDDGPIHYLYNFAGTKELGRLSCSGSGLRVDSDEDICGQVCCKRNTSFLVFELVVLVRETSEYGMSSQINVKILVGYGADHDEAEAVREILI